MRSKKFTNKQIIEALNTGTNNDIVWIANNSDYWEFTSVIADYELEPGEVVKVATEVASISPKDLREWWEHADVDIINDALVEMYAPFSDGDYCVEDIFKTEELDDLYSTIFEAGKDYIEAHPHILSDSRPDRVRSTKEFILTEDNTWKLATKEEIKAFYLKEVNRELEQKAKDLKRQALIASMTEEERELLFGNDV